MAQQVNQRNHGQRPAVILLRPRRTRQRRFRWELLGLIVALLVFLYIGRYIRILYSFDDIMAACNIIHTLRYRQMVVLGILVVGIVAVAKVLRSK
jgi:hypothetical protein